MSAKNYQGVGESEETFAETAYLEKREDLTEGTRVHRYLILALLGKGGMGAVYKAYDPELDRRIAIKILTVTPQEGETASLPQARLMREAQALARLNHPHVVSVFDVGTHEDGVYIAMEFVEGKTLRDWLSQDNPSQNEIIEVFLKAGRGLQSAHAVGIVHRDFKPENLLVGKSGEVKVLDFGLARAGDFESAPLLTDKPKSDFESQSSDTLLSHPLTQVGALIGTIAYMAPEHFLSQELDEKTDQFSFCVTLFEALYGERPFLGSNKEDLETRVVEGQVTVPDDKQVPHWMQDVVLRGLSVCKEDRFESVASLLAALVDDPQIEKAKKRKRFLLLLSFAFAAVLFFGIGTIFFDRTTVCTGADKKVAGIWHGREKIKIKHAFAKTGVSYANDTFVRLENRLNDYLQQWKSEYTEVCQATRIRQEQSEEVMYLKMSCLTRQLKNAEALIRVFLDADRTIVAKAVGAAESLGRTASCNDLQALRSKVFVAQDDHTKFKVESLRDELAHAVALSRTGKYQKSLERIERIRQDSEFIDYKPLQAEVLYWHGRLLERTAAYQAAESTLNNAAFAAGACRDSLLAAKAMAWLAWLVGYHQMRPQEGLQLGQNALVMLMVAGGDETVRARLYNNMGVVLESQGEYQKALDYHQKSLTIRKRALGAEHPHVAHPLNNMGNVYSMLGKPDKASEHFQRALEIWEKALGPQHPEVATTLNNLGIVLENQGKYSQALQYHQRSLAIREKSLGRMHPRVAWPLRGIGNAFVSQGRYRDALDPLERVIRICTKATCHPEPHGRGLFGLARALVATGGDLQRAQELAKQARRVFGKTPKRFTNEIEQLKQWFRKNRFE